MEKEEQLKVLKEARKHTTSPAMQKDLDKKIKAIQENDTIEK